MRKKSRKFLATRSFTTEEETPQGSLGEESEKERHDQSKHILLKDLLKNPPWNSSFCKHVTGSEQWDYHTPLENQEESSR